MDWIKVLLDLVLHLNTHLDSLVAQYGPWVYLILFAVVFCETGLVVTPFLPGDSLLFAAGVVASGGRLNPTTLVGLLLLAAIAGDTVNYSIGRYAGHQLAARFPRIIKPEYLRKTHAFYERYGGKTIVIARFVPIVRTFAPFVGGMAEMTYRRFMMYNIVGAALWVLLLVPTGYFFANVPFVQKNFSLVILAIIIISILPAAYEIVKHRRRAPTTS